MNIYNFFLNFSSTAQQLNSSTAQQLNSPKIDLFLKFSFWALLFSFSTSVIAQPDSFTVTSSCDPWSDGQVEGVYTRHATDVAGCPCYDGPNGSIKKAFGEWGYFSAPCPNASASAILYSSGSDPCDIATATNQGCNFNSIIFPSSPSDVPTLSEWGLIILALLLMTFGTLYLVQPKWRKQFEKEE